jgi:hypothetical protein
MLHIITPCSRPFNLLKILDTIPTKANWIICYDNKHGDLPIQSHNNIEILNCVDTGAYGVKARNHVLDNYSFNDNDSILFHDDDNIIHPDLYTEIQPLLDNDYSMICWGQLNSDNSIRLYPPRKRPRIYWIDTASYLIKWRYNKNIRHIEKYTSDGYYAQACYDKTKTIRINKFLSYYNYLRNT